MSKWVITSSNNKYWSNQWGWGEREGCDMFDDLTYELPIGGIWTEIIHEGGETMKEEEVTPINEYKGRGVECYQLICPKLNGDVCNIADSARYEGCYTDYCIHARIVKSCPYVNVSTFTEYDIEDIVLNDQLAILHQMVSVVREGLSCEVGGF